MGFGFEGEDLNGFYYPYIHLLCMVQNIHWYGWLAMRAPVCTPWGSGFLAVHPVVKLQHLLVVGVHR